MKALFAFFAFAVVAFFIGCSSLSLNGPDQVSGKSVIHFKAEFGASESGTKTTLIGDGLTIVDRQNIFSYRKGKVKFINFDFYKNGSVTTRTHTFRFPVINGEVSGDMSVLPGLYTMIEVTTDRQSLSDLPDCDFLKVITNYNVDTSGVDTLNVLLEQNQSLKSMVVISVPAGLYVEGKSYPFYFMPDQPWDFFGWSFDPIFQGGKIVWSGVDVLLKKNDCVFKIGDNVLSGNFDVTKILDNDTIEMTAITTRPIAVNIGFANNQAPVIDSVYPKDSATNVPTDIQNIVAYFNKPLADLSDMPGAQFGIASEDGTDQVTGTYGLSANIFSRQLVNASEHVYLKRNTKYIVHVSAVKDEYGNEMVSEKRWSFITGNN